MIALQIEGEMTIYRAAEWKDLFMTRLKDPGSLEVDLSAVSEIDTAGIQLLMLIKKTAQKQGRALHLKNHSAVVLEVFDLLGLVPYFGDPVVLQKA